MLPELLFGQLVFAFHCLCLQGHTLFLTDLRKPEGVPTVPEGFNCCCKGRGHGGRRTVPQRRILLSKTQIPRQDSSQRTRASMEGHLCIKNCPFKRQQSPAKNSSWKASRHLTSTFTPGLLCLHEAWGRGQHLLQLPLLHSVINNLGLPSPFNTG